jgi:hypothetical protein
MKKLIPLMIAIFALSTAYPAYSSPKKGKNDIPYGLKKQDKLPPGWEKKLKVGSTLDPDIRSHGTVIEAPDELGKITIKVEGKVIRLVDATNEILEVLTE